MKHKKHVETYKIKDFTNLVDESLYPNYFTDKEIYAFGKKRKKGSLAARYLIKKLLTEYFNNKIKFADIEILNDEMGKPSLKISSLPSSETEHIYFSLSHTKDTVAVLIIFENHGV